MPHSLCKSWSYWEKKKHNYKLRRCIVFKQSVSHMFRIMTFFFKYTGLCPSKNNHFFNYPWGFPIVLLWQIVKKNLLGDEIYFHTIPWRIGELLNLSKLIIIPLRRGGCPFFGLKSWAICQDLVFHFYKVWCSTVCGQLLRYLVLFQLYNLIPPAALYRLKFTVTFVSYVTTLNCKCDFWISLF